MDVICSILATHWLQSVLLRLFIGCNLFYSGLSLAVICCTLASHWLQSVVLWLLIGCNLFFSGFSLAAICSTLAPHWLESVLIWLLIGCIMFYYGSLLAVLCSAVLWVTLQFVFVANLSSDYILILISPCLGTILSPLPAGIKWPGPTTRR